MLSKIDLTQGGITGTLLRFTLPMIIGSLLQQCYNIADTLIVGQCIGSGALAAVGSAYTLMVFLISILLGLSMGSGTVFSLQYGAGRTDSLRRNIYVSALLIGTVTLILNIAAFVWIHPILRLLQIPKDIYGMMYDYLWIIFWGIGFTFIYNFYAALLRAIRRCRYSSLVSGGFRCTEHRAGFILYLAVGLGNQGSSHRHGSRTGSIRFGNYGICLREIPRTEITPQRPAFRPSLPERDHFVLRTDLCTTVGDESGHSDGTRIGQ